MKILGISAYYHDSAAALLVNGEIIAAAQEERFTRVKHTEAFPINAITFCLNQAQLNIGDIDAVVFYDKPFLKFERLLETYMAFAPKGFRAFLKSMPVWLNDKLFLKYRIKKEFEQLNGFNKQTFKLLFTEHHLSHAASTFFPSNFKSAAILNIDGVGEWCTTSIGIGTENQIEFLKEQHFPHSVGLLYSAFTYYLGFKVNSGEYKLMGLAPYGQKNSPEVNNYINIIKTHLVDVKDDGSVFLNQQYYNYAVGLTMANDKKWENLLRLKKRNDHEDITQQHCNLALAIQLITEEIVIKLAHEAKRLTNCENLCLAGGVALNCVANASLLQANIFKNIYVQPAAGDAGGALGSALAAYYIYFNQPKPVKDNDALKGSFLGPQFMDSEIEEMCSKNKAVFEKIPDEYLYKKIAELISEGNIVGWFQGKMEFGPRALGNRSILADPRNEDMQKKLNLKIKFREGFRPFAPSVLEEKAHLFFEMKSEKLPYMLFTAQIIDSLKNEIPVNYDQLSMWDKLYYKRSKLPAITHVDFSARVQTVSKQTNPRFHQLITEFENLTNTPVLINTSFNVRGEPIVCSPNDAYRCFMATDIDVLIINNFVFLKTKQAHHTDKQKWQTQFEKD
ncbi:MAG: carbamoyltransferase [Bacteroidetes bacterium]|nr:carbamoyltransferase [Bacteroidota bacterium]